MSYENAPATALVATVCVACGRPLVDSISVNTGMGPDCREKYGLFVEGVTAEAQADVNGRVHAIATGKLDAGDVCGHLVMIRAYGFTTLADKLEERLVAIFVEPVDAVTISIAAPYDERFTAALKASTPWRRWDGAAKRWLVPASESVREKVWAAMRRHFSGAIGKGGAAGFFVVKPIA